MKEILLQDDKGKGKKGQLVETEQVHHIKPLSEGGDHSRENLIALCSSCHARIHAERGDRWHTH